MTSKLQNTKNTSKSFWSLLKIFLTNKKIPLNPPFFHSNPFILDFKHRAELFNDFFLKSSSLINNNSKLPTNLNHVSDRHLPSVTFSAGDVAKIIQNLNSNNKKKKYISQKKLIFTRHTKYIKLCILK